MVSAVEQLGRRNRCDRQVCSGMASHLPGNALECSVQEIDADVRVQNVDHLSRTLVTSRAACLRISARDGTPPSFHAPKADSVLDGTAFFPSIPD